MAMYEDIVDNATPNVKIMGIDFYAEEINPEVSYNYREINENPILGGTVHVTRGEYVLRRFNITTTIYHPKNRPDVYNKIFKEMMSKPVEVISPYMGGKFKANVIINVNPQEASPNHLELSIDISEIPEVNSNIPGESKFIVPTTSKVKNQKKDSKNDTVNKELNTKLKNCKVPFKKNQNNVCVKLLQEKLIVLGYLDKRNKTGKYDNKTIEAVKKYQRSTKGKLLVDGVFGPYTLKSILKT